MINIGYYLEPGKKENLYCRISDGKYSVSFSLGYIITLAEGVDEVEGIPVEDPHYSTLMNFKEYLRKRYHELIHLEMSTANVLKALEDEAKQLLSRPV
ncbi:hypothetical protein GCM10007390_30230 [Persicitalea jodogahamensis]|uniref:Uncharacterized protein n=1 Tax=Persicitalea jodogahamensis TaxID=402147 RepID=A0A8J3DAD9_9BACT|nr:hypothetical protein GCM10007390_30230 [Persicitalea jodogahamensis]